MKMKLLCAMFCTVLVLGFTSCSDDDNTPNISNVDVTLQIPAGAGDVFITSGEFVFKNVSTGLEAKQEYGKTTGLNLVDGLYNVTFIGDGIQKLTTKQQAENNVKVRVQGAKQNVQIIGGAYKLQLELAINGYEEGNFVIAEIYATGTYLPGTTSQYNGDQYIRIHNNSSDTLYADNLILLESKFRTTTKNDYTPDIMSEAMTTQIVARIPGTGKDYPVYPGKSIIVCDNAMNHLSKNSNSFDLSNADFEWFLSTSGTSSYDVDNPNVPNLEMSYAYTKTMWVLNKQGNRTYAIGRLPEGMDTDTYLTDYTYSYHYTMANGKQSSEQIDYRFENTWIIDAVNLSAKNEHVWNLVHHSVDMGFASFGNNSSLAENVGKAVVRKVTYSDEDKTFYQDTNNSSVDFDTIDKPTLKK